MAVKVTTSVKKIGRTETQVLLAQYFTPTLIADFMTAMFSSYRKNTPTILDPGAGEGILGLSLATELKDTKPRLTSVEFDKPTFSTLKSNVEELGLEENCELINDDFINAALALEEQGKRYSHIILNPPYFKLRVDSSSSKTLRLHGIQVTNIYAAFVWLSARLLEDDGQLVAIIPRSFCNGPYFLKFRQYITQGFSVDWIHIFGSRDKAFSRDNVLQENVIIRISKREQTSKVKLSYSTDQSFTDIATKQVPIDNIISPQDNSNTIHIPAHNQTLRLNDYLSGSLKDLEITASTGPIVDFRFKESILKSITTSSIPLLYPAHISGHETNWPLIAFKKIGQHYQPSLATSTTLLLEGIDTASDKNTLPLDGYYVIVRRFSSKEEKRRIFAAVVSPENFKSKSITFENHLNYFHSHKHGFDKDIAFGLCAYLNSSVLDEHFRKVSGHTQVNVSDLKNLPYPTKEQLQKLGAITRNIDGLIDDIVTREILGATK